MSKPWEETWRWNSDFPGDVFGRDGGDVVAEFQQNSYEDHPDEYIGRAKLAASAPEMARLLLKLSRDPECPSCGDHPFYDDSSNELTYRHETDCELVSVLRKAGVAS